MFISLSLGDVLPKSRLHLHRLQFHRGESEKKKWKTVKNSENILPQSQFPELLPFMSSILCRWQHTPNSTRLHEERTCLRFEMLQQQLLQLQQQRQQQHQRPRQQHRQPESATWSGECSEPVDDRPASICIALHCLNLSIPDPSSYTGKNFDLWQITLIYLRYFFLI